MRDVLRRLLAVVLLVALAWSAVPAGEELTVTARRENKHEVLLLLEGEIVMLGKWPLKAYLFDTSGLEGCSLSYTMNIIDLEQVRLKKDGPEATVVCGRTTAAGLPVTDLAVTTGAEVTTGRRSWGVTADGETLRLHLRVPGESEWTVSLTRP